MGKIIKDSNGKVLMNSNGGAYSVTAAIDSNIVPNNIKKDVSILGVTGTLEVAVEAPENDVNFYDYDGFRVASYTITEAKALTALPTPPTHEGLTFQEWNWTLADIQGYNRKYIDIGSNYVPTDGKTHIKFSPQEDGCYIGFGIVITTKSKLVVVDWGDGNSNEKSAGTDGGNTVWSHTYTNSGTYDIKIYSKNGDVTFSMTLQNANTNGIRFIKEINIGSDHKGMECGNFKCLLTLSTYFVDYMKFNKLVCPLVAIPRNTQSAFSLTDMLSNTLSIISFPKVVPSFSGTRIAAKTSNGRLIVPEVASNGIFTASSIGTYDYNYILSLPNSLQWSSQPTSNIWVSNSSLQIIDIVQGWTPNYSISFNASNSYSAGAMVDFFNKLGTTATTITLTFGSTNLNKLTADQKAIATNKGYTLA